MLLGALAVGDVANEVEDSGWQFAAGLGVDAEVCFDPEIFSIAFSDAVLECAAIGASFESFDDHGEFCAVLRVGEFDEVFPDEVFWFPTDESVDSGRDEGAYAGEVGEDDDVSRVLHHEVVEGGGFFEF